MGLWVLVHLQSSDRPAAVKVRPLPASEGDSGQKRVQSEQEIATERNHSLDGYRLYYLEEWVNLARIIFKEKD